MTSFMDTPYKRPAAVPHLSVAFLAGLYYLLRARARRLKSKSYIYYTQSAAWLTGCASRLGEVRHQAALLSQPLHAGGQRGPVVAESGLATQVKPYTSR